MHSPFQFCFSLWETAWPNLFRWAFRGEDVGATHCGYTSEVSQVHQRALITEVSYHAHRSCSHPAHIPNCDIQFTFHSNSAGKSTILWEEGLWIYLCKLTKTEGTTERCLSKQLTGCCCYRPVFTCSSGKKLILLFTKNLERDLHHTSSSLSGWFYSRDSTERDTQSLCLLPSLRRAQMGRKAAEHVTQVCLSVCFMAWMLDQLQCP